MTNTGLEYQFLTNWTDWDIIDTFCLQFYGCTLKEDVANIVGFTEAAVVILDGEHCVIQFMEDDESEPVEFKFTAHLLIK